jgi:hypothetical protein
MSALARSALFFITGPMVQKLIFGGSSVKRWNSNG